MSPSVSTSKPEVDETKQRPSGRAKAICPCCGSAAAEWDSSQIGGGKLAICCQECGAVVHLAAELVKAPKVKILEDKKLHSSAMACGGSKEMGEKYRTEYVKKRK